MKRKFKKWSDGHQFHQYQQYEQSPLILTKLTEQKQTTIYDVGNPGIGLQNNITCDNTN
jgi:hypothetical protein